MMRPAAVVRMVVAAGFGILAAACGTSGSRPIFYPEVQFQVIPSCAPPPAPCFGHSDFTVELVTNGVSHTFPDTTQMDGAFHFTASSTFNFYLENAPPPYGAKFTLVDNMQGGVPVGTDDLTVVLSVTGQTKQTAQTSGVNSAAVVGSFTPGLPPPAIEVRFDVCLPSATPGTCFSATESGIFGLPFGGSIGDANETHLLSATVPSIYFLESAANTVNSVFVLTPTTGQNLFAELFVNKVLKETASGTGEIVLRQDL